MILVVLYHESIPEADIIEARRAGREALKSLVGKKEMAKKKTQVHLGMGAIVYPGGVAFRLWAPHADAVFVRGEFNNWSETDHGMTREGDGYWYVDVHGAKTSQEYLFRIHADEQRLDRIDPYARQVTNSSGNGVIYDPASFNWEDDDAFSPPPQNELVIYELHVGSFFTPDQGKVGEFADAVEKFAHLKRLGVNAIQIMPVAEFAGDYSWGYNPAHIYAVESTYGGPDGLKRFVKLAHKNGLAVIQDVVYNHFGPSDLDLWQFDGWSENGKGGIYFFQDERSKTPWGDTRPDYGRVEVANFIRDNAIMWLDEYHIDGLRWDMTLYIRTIDGSVEIPEGWALMRRVNSEVRARHPHVILIAEDLQGEPTITRSDVDGGAGFHAQWDKYFVHPVRDVITQISDESRSMDVIRDAILFKYNNDAFRRVIYSESHDEVANGQARLPYDVDPDDPTGWFAQKRSTLAAGLVFTSPGIPMLFQGQEFLQGEWFRDDVPLNWDLNDEFRGIVRLYRDLARLRQNWNNDTRGLRGQFINVFHVNNEDNMLAFQRWDQHGQGDDVVVVMNFSTVPRQNYVIGVPDKGLWKLRLNSDAQIYSPDFENYPSGNMDGLEGGMNGLSHHGMVNIAPYSMLIYSQE